MEGWIDLGVFSTKYGVSQSTLRRRIRAKAIPFRMERGKYLLKDSPETLSVAPLFSRHPGSENHGAEEVVEAPVRPVAPTPVATTTPRQIPAPPRQSIPDPVAKFFESEDVMPVFLREDYERLLVENRRLKEQVAELETLVKALEAELDL